jgi:hypothetical protein
VRTWFRSALVALALLGAFAPTVRAQEEPPPPEDKNADWSAAFEQGLDLLRLKRVDESIRAFEICIRLFPDRAVAYYNIACAHSIGKRPEKAVEWLKKSFDKGFLDLGHIGRDSDLDNVRNHEKFKALIEETKKKILAGRPAAKKILPEKADGKLPLLVYLRAEGTTVEDAQKKLGDLADALGVAILIPSGKGEKGGWDTTAETCIVSDVQAALSEESRLDAKKVVLVGEAEGATLAWKVGLENGWKRVVAAAGAYEKVEGDKAKGLRAWLIAPRPFDAALNEAAEARDEILKAGGHVFIERHDEKAAFPKDTLETIERAVKWTLDDEAKAPDAGDSHKF